MMTNARSFLGELKYQAQRLMTLDKHYDSAVPIKAVQWAYLRELKPVIPIDFHAFYDNLFHRRQTFMIL